MHDINAILRSAADSHRRGNYETALSFCEQILASLPEQWDALFLRGTILLQMGRIDECILPLEYAVACKSDSADAANNLGVAYQAAGRWDDAARMFESAVRAQPNYSQALFNLGVLHESRGTLDRAEAAFRQLLFLRGDDANTRFRLGNLLNRKGRHPEAEELFREVLRAEPNHLDARVNLGVALVHQERLGEAVVVFRDVLNARRDFAEIHANLSYVLERDGKIAEAIDAARRGIELRPDHAEGWNNLGIALRADHRLDEAREAFGTAIGISSEFALAEFNLSTTLLLAGCYREGWPGYARHAEALGGGPRQFPQPVWQGSPLPGRTLLVYADQGFGDTIQFASFLRGIRDLSQARVILECQPALKGLFAKLEGVDLVLSSGELPPNVDAVVPLVRLPAILNVDMVSVGENVPYLHAPNRLNDELGKLVASIPTDVLRVGLVWQGNPRQARDVVRSCPFACLKPLFDIPGISFVSLQSDETGRRQITETFAEGLPGNLLDAGRLLHDFSNTADLMHRLDLILTVDTAAAHLAGALGRPTWTMLCHTPDWRWHLDRADSPWYPTMRLFRQPRWGDWEAVVAEVGRELKSLQSRGRSASLRGPHSSIPAAVKQPPA